jgi:transposase
MAYPKKMREQALEAVRKGYTKTQVNEMFGLGINTLKSWEKLEEETGSLENRPLDRKSRKINLEELRKYCEENPFATHIEAGIYFDCSERVIRYSKKKLGITRKKRHPAT